MTVAELIEHLQSVQNKTALVETDPGWHPEGAAYVNAVHDFSAEGGSVMLDWTYANPNTGTVDRL